MKRICLDFDGVIFPNLKYKRSGLIKGEPVKGALEAIKELSKSYEVLIHSTRFNDNKGWIEVKRWLDEHGFTPYVGCVTGKPLAFIYVDDRGVCFNGDWTQTINDIEAFKQWQSDTKTRNRIQRKRLRRK